MSWNGTASGLPAETRHYLQTIFGGAGVPGVPGLAEGALVTRQTLAMIAEGNRPEMVIPLSKLGHLGTTYIHVDKIVIEGDSNNPERQAERIRSRLIRQGRRNGDIFGGYDG
jgi:SLT domain-containing protein